MFLAKPRAAKPLQVSRPRLAAALFASLRQPFRTKRTALTSRVQGFRVLGFRLEGISGFGFRV